MAIYHFSAKVISRARGSSAVASAAYRAAQRLHDERLGRTHDFTNKAGVVHSEVLLPDSAPQRWSEREVFWNEVEAVEVRKDAQLAREIEFALPREMSQADGVELARSFVTREFVSRGMAADLSVHWDIAEDGEAKPHAHVMLALREAGTEGFGAKVRDWNSTELLNHWREAWASQVNGRLAELGIDTRIDHRSLADQGVALEPQNKIGAAASAREGRGEAAERRAEHRAIARRNGEAILGDPRLGLDAITRQQSTFTDHDLMRFAHRHSDDAAQFQSVVSALRTSPELVRLGRDGAGRDRFTTRDMLGVERRLADAAERIGSRQGHLVARDRQALALANAERAGLSLGEGQTDAFLHVTGGRDLALVVGYAGSGKSAMLSVARTAWEAQGLNVRGAALSGIAAESLEGGSGIGSRTLASLEHAWAQGREVLGERDVLVIDEAGLVGSRQLERVLGRAEVAGAKVVLVGDAEQLQAIEAGAAFRALAERHGAVEITEIRRQIEDWQKAATREFATGRTDEALARYATAGRVHAHADRSLARAALVESWDRDRKPRPKESRIILAHTRAEVGELNHLARGKLADAGDLGHDQFFTTTRGERAFASGDRIMFLRNERSMGVKNGSLGTIARSEGSRFLVRLDGGDAREVVFDLKDYADLDHGYAATLHKSQGVTVDRAYVLATDGLDRHATYVGMSRHRLSVELHYGGDDFEDVGELARILGRDRAKDTTLDFEAAFAVQRGLLPAIDEPGERRSIFAGFKPPSDMVQALKPTPGMAVDFTQAISHFTNALGDVLNARLSDRPVTADLKLALKRAEAAFGHDGAEALGDLKAALDRRPGLAVEFGRSEDLGLIRAAMAREAAARRDPAVRADQFVGDWRRLKGAYEAMADRRSLQRPIERELVGLAESLGRDPALAAILSSRRQEIGLGPARGLDLGRDLVRSLERGRDLDLGLG